MRSSLSCSERMRVGRSTPVDQCPICCCVLPFIFTLLSFSSLFSRILRDRNLWPICIRITTQRQGVPCRIVSRRSCRVLLRYIVPMCKVVRGFAARTSPTRIRAERTCTIAVEWWKDDRVNAAMTTLRYGQ